MIRWILYSLRLFDLVLLTHSIGYLFCYFSIYPLASHQLTLIMLISFKEKLKIQMILRTNFIGKDFIDIIISTIFL